MFRGSPFALRTILILAVLVAGLNLTQPRASAQDFAAPHDLIARGRVFPTIAGGVLAIRKDRAGHYYILAVPAKSIFIYQADGKRIGAVPRSDAPSPGLLYAGDFDIDAAGRIIVADTDGSLVRVFDPDGSQQYAFPIRMPSAIAALPDGTFAVQSLLEKSAFFRVFSNPGKGIRSVEDHSQSAEAAVAINSDRLYGDGAGAIYMVLNRLENPTVRKYDAYGAAAYEYSLAGFESPPATNRKEWTRFTIDPALRSSARPVSIQAFAADPESQETWVAISDQLVHFDKDGDRRAAYRLSTAAGAPIQPTALLIEHARILIADEQLGIFDFPLPERMSSSAARP